MWVDVGQEAPCVVMWPHVCGCGSGGPMCGDVGPCVWMWGRRPHVGQDVPCGSMWLQMWMWGRAFHVGPCGSGGPISVDVGQEAPCGAGCSIWVHVAPCVWMWVRPPISVAVGQDPISVDVGQEPHKCGCGSGPP